jgi:predicted kinase
LAGDIATFHQNAAGAERETLFGTPGLIAEVIAEVFERIPSDGRFSEHHPSLEQLRHWLTRFLKAHAGVFEKRKAGGFIRECHGDLHLANLVLLDDRIIAFDGIEFSERLRWIDVINDVAFTVMDFQVGGQPALARRFLNRYLEFTGDYEGLGLLPFYEVYRALVRVKVAALAFAQVRGQGILSHADDFVRYLSAAQSLTEAQAPWLVIMHGVTGTGKSTISETLLEETGAIRLRSDVERKRLFGLSPSDRSSGEIRDALYGTETTRKTYDRLQALARQLLLFGYPGIVDGTFLKRQHRNAFKKLAASLNVPFLILDMQAKPATLRERIASRAIASDDVSEADRSVLEQQERDQEPLAPDERASTLRLHSGDPFDPAEVVGMLESTREEGT